MKRKPRISLPMKKPGKVDIARDTGVTFADVAMRGSQTRAVKELPGLAYDQAKETLVSHRDQLELVAAELLKSETIDGPTFHRLVSQEKPSLRDPGRLAAALAMQSKEKSKLVGHAM
jgi:ATP-dependent Zn protease